MVLITTASATYTAFSGQPTSGKTSTNSVIWLLNIDLILLLGIVALIAKRIATLWSRQRSRGSTGTSLHARLIYAFSLLAAMPVIVVTIASAFFFHFGVQTWFSERVKTAINESQAVAQAYFDEHRQVIRADTLAMANDINREAPFLVASGEAFAKALRTQSFLRNLSEALVFDSSGHVLARSGLTFSLEFEDIPRYALRQANDGDVAIVTGTKDDRIRALIKLNNFVDTYLYVGRMVDPKVLSHLAKTKEATEDYASLQKRYSEIEIMVTMIFIVIGVALVLSAIWYGLLLARKLVEPIDKLIAAADHVRAGDLTARVQGNKAIEEFDYLAGSFNTMTAQIQQQQNELLAANAQINRRRRLIESVLRGVSSGVFGIDTKNTINLANASALDLLGLKDKDVVGHNIESVLPDAHGLLKKAHKRPHKATQAEILFIQDNGTKRTFLVRIVIEKMGEEDIGAILTFDDITELQSAQRKAAWADVARRIAHEIKNPLTPIHLSAERLKKKYQEFIKDDPSAFERYTETIIRNVEDIERMVNEFAAFSRMPEAVMKQGNITGDIEETVFLHGQAHPHITFGFTHEDFSDVHYDSQQIRQALNNLLQNAIDSLRMKAEQGQSITPYIDILLTHYGQDELAIAVTDNGIGLPKVDNPTQLTEPYVTHKPKGTGLGLAIVKKIMEDHDGTVLLEVPDWLKSNPQWTDRGGATVILLLPLRHNKQEEIKAA